MMKNNTDDKKQKFIKDLLPFTLAELAVSALVVLLGFVLSLVNIISFDYRIITGALLGAAVMILNYTFLTASVDKAIQNFISLRGEKEMSDEEAEQFAAENSMPIQNAIKTSYIIRTVTMIATLVVAFLLDWFNPLATAIPLLAFRPLLTVIEMIKGKVAK